MTVYMYTYGIICRRRMHKVSIQSLFAVSPFIHAHGKYAVYCLYTVFHTVYTFLLNGMDHPSCTAHVDGPVGSKGGLGYTT
jgi:hypothetical protein